MKVSKAQHSSRKDVSSVIKAAKWLILNQEDRQPVKKRAFVTSRKAFSIRDFKTRNDKMKSEGTRKYLHRISSMNKSAVKLTCGSHRTWHAPRGRSCCRSPTVGLNQTLGNGEKFLWYCQAIGQVRVICSMMKAASKSTPTQELRST